MSILSCLGTSLTTTVAWAIVVWLLRNAIVTRLTASVKHEYDVNLEKLRAEIRQSEELSASERRAIDQRIAGLQSGALSALASRQIAVDRRRLDAIDQIWSSVTAYEPLKALSEFMSVFNFEKAAEASQRDSRAREYFDRLGAGFDVTRIDRSGAARARPFVTPMVWATYSAYTAVLAQAAFRHLALKTGIGAVDLTKDGEVRRLVSLALPSEPILANERSAAPCHHLLVRLEERLLGELVAMLAGAKSDEDSIARASEIQRAADRLLTQPKPTSDLQISLPKQIADLCRLQETEQAR